MLCITNSGHVHALEAITDCKSSITNIKMQHLPASIALLSFLEDLEPVSASAWYISEFARTICLLWLTKQYHMMQAKLTSERHRRGT